MEQRERAERIERAEAREEAARLKALVDGAVRSTAAIIPRAFILSTFLQLLTLS